MAFGAEGGGSFGGFSFPGSQYYRLPGYFYDLFKTGKVFITNPFQGFEDMFIEGKPKRLDTIQAVLRAGESRNPVVRQYGRDLALLEGGGIVTSTSDPAGRAALNKIFAKAVEGLEAQGVPRKRAFLELSNVISNGASGALIPPPMVPAPLSAMQPQRSAVPSQTLPRFPGQSNAQSFANQIGRVLLDTVPGLREFEDLTGMQIQPPEVQPLIDFFKPPGLQSGMYPKNPFQPVNPSMYPKNPFQPVNPFQPGNPQTPQNPQYPLPPQQPGDVPTVDPSKCQGCTPKQRQLQRELENQKGQLQREIQTEQQQQGDKQLTQQQQQLQHFKDLESQPSQGRDIQRELQQKAELLNQIERELEDLQFLANNPGSQASLPQSGNGGNPPVQTQPSPVAQPGEVPTVQTNHAHGRGELDELDHEKQLDQIFMQGQPSNDMPDASKAVKFCVACATQNDAYLFLNGEPSACSVVPQ
ncbi:MAG: hypothetical protein RB191_11340 [Terriglobia bacterium]|nr:hypothetical protein [Terriglobia bacterium]